MGKDKIGAAANTAYQMKCPQLLFLVYQQLSGSLMGLGISHENEDPQREQRSACEWGSVQGSGISTGLGISMGMGISVGIRDQHGDEDQGIL